MGRGICVKASTGPRQGSSGQFNAFTKQTMGGSLDRPYTLVMVSPN